ncbi:Glycogen debranching enzyme [Trichinella spiralis]|uniref:Glycogen debranching enzyme n=1 Tax=Trichinella spiralis TaxID=6334 RepID=A0ABR3KFH9_TRISP
MIKLSSTAPKFKQVGIFYITATLLVIHIQAIPENENTGTEKTFANSNSGEADNADEDHVKRALAEHKQKLRYNQVSAIVKPKHRLVHDNYSYSKNLQ